jgi:hypothetical protein
MSTFVCGGWAGASFDDAGVPTRDGAEMWEVLPDGTQWNNPGVCWDIWLGE